MKKYFILLSNAMNLPFFILLIPSLFQAQPDIEWHKCLGGTNREGISFSDFGVNIYNGCVRQTQDEGYIVAASTLSNDGDVTGFNGLSVSTLTDIWVVKLDEIGEIEWQKCLGGTHADVPRSIEQTVDGGYIVAGYTSSNDGDVNGWHEGYSGPGLPYLDCWLVKLSGVGEIEWQKCLGGSNWDYAYSAQQTSDDGYILAGYTKSSDGDVDGNHGNDDSWIVKLNASGNIEWQKCYGGSNLDHAYSIQQTTDEGYIVAGITKSSDGDVTGFKGNRDYWILKLDNTGNIEWQKCMGGSGTEEAYSLQKTVDGGYIVAGYTNSNDGDVTGNNGQSDYWIVKLSESGLIEWQKCLGLATEEIAYSILVTSTGSYLVAGEMSSNSGGYWLVELSESGDEIWQHGYGGTNRDIATSIVQTIDGGFVVVGATASNDLDVSGNHSADGGFDIWLVKLSESLGLLEEDSIANDQILSPNPTTHLSTLSLTKNHNAKKLYVTDLSGSVIYSNNLGPTSNQQIIDVSNFERGIYIVQVVYDDGHFATIQLVKQ